MLSVTSKYAVRSLRFLKRQESQGLVRVEEIARKIGVPAPYLSKVMKILVKHGLLESRRGAHGGVRLKSPTQALSVYEVCLATEDPVITSQCLLSQSGCDPSHPCPMHGEYAKIRDHISKFLMRTRVY